MKSVFISHSSKDKSIVRRLSSDLTKNNIQVWLDENEIFIGDSITSKIQEGLEKADYVIVVLSHNSSLSGWVEKEWQSTLHLEAKTNEAIILPVTIDDCPIPTLLKDKLHADLNTDYDKGVSQLIRSINRDQESNLKKKILIDEYYDQKKWRPLSPTKNGGYKEIFNSVKDIASITSNIYDFEEVDLDNYNVLILPAPFKMRISEQKFSKIRNWVSKGNGLIVLGFYMMEAHHDLNLNTLINPMGLKLEKSLLMPEGIADRDSCIYQSTGYSSSSDKRFWTVSEFDSSDETHEIIKGVKKIAFMSSCPVDYIKDFDLELTTKAKLNFITPRGEIQEHGRIEPIYKYETEKTGKAKFLIAKEYGDGKIIGIGSWKIFFPEFCKDQVSDNKKLFRNIINWI